MLKSLDKLFKMPRLMLAVIDFKNAKILSYNTRKLFYCSFVQTGEPLIYLGVTARILMGMFIKIVHATITLRLLTMCNLFSKQWEKLSLLEQIGSIVDGL